MAKTTERQQVLTFGVGVGKVAENADGSDIVSDSQLSALIACDSKRQSHFVPFVVIASQRSSSRRSATTTPLVEDSDGVGATVGNEHEPVVVGTNAMRLQQRPVIGV